MAYWNKDAFVLTRHAELKVFFWAITKSKHGIEDCLFSFQQPWYVRERKNKKQIYFCSPVALNIPTYLIEECGEKVLNNKFWNDLV